MKLGNKIVITGTFKNASSTLTSPSTVELRITKPDGTSETLTATESSAGIWAAEYQPTTAGVYYVAMVGTAGLLAADDASFRVEALRA